MKHIRIPRTADGEYHATVEPCGEWPLDSEIEDDLLDELLTASKRKGAGAGLPEPLRELVAGLDSAARKALRRALEG